MPIQVELAPAFTIRIGWTNRLADALKKHFGTAIVRPDTQAELAQAALNEWKYAELGASRQVQRFFALTGALPVEGDKLVVHTADMSSPKYLFIRQRELHTTPDSDALDIIFAIENNDFEEENEFGEESGSEA